ncbi:MAG TPA: MFS transporter [Gemmatimonadota bacterium]|nr:MFS transporter [Gemmatimonadota bacterium]
MSEAPRGAPASPWAPLRHPTFRAIWAANVVSYIGTWVQQVAAQWLMTDLAPDPVMVALVQAATGLAMFTLVVPAGALADLVDRRKVLIGCQVWQLLAAAGLGVLTVGGWVTPWTLLLFTLLLGFGAAVNQPAWNAVLPELVPREELPSAIVSTSVGVNVARAVGPALGGALVASVGAGAAFLANAASYLGLVGVLARWRRPAEDTGLPAEPFPGAVRAGLRYVRHTPQMVSVLVRVGLFVFAGSALWALLPLVARARLGLSAGGFGLVVTAFGLGAVAGAAALGPLRRRLSMDLVVTVSTIVFGLSLAAVGEVRLFLPFLGVAFVAGGAWLNLLSGYNTAAQTVLPSWVRARGMSLYVLVFFGGTTAGSVAWGAVASRWGLPAALAVAGALVLLGVLARGRWRIEETEGLDLSPTRHWPAPILCEDVENEHGPVLVTVEYAVAPGRHRAFEEAMADVGRRRRRSGAYYWELFEDSSEPGRYTEIFLVESWAEHLRQHGRVTGLDRQAEARAQENLEPGSRPVIRHHLAATGRRPGGSR